MVRAADGPDAGATIALQLLDGAGRPQGQPITVSDSPTAALDVDLVRLDSSMVIAWTDRRDIDGHVFVAATDINGRVTVPAHPLTSAFGEQSFISLIAPRSGNAALLVYEDISQRAPKNRAIRLTTLDAKAAAGSLTLAIDFPSGDRELPEFAAAPDGFVVLTSAPACTSGRPCADPTPVPSYVRVDPSLSVMSGSPLWVDKLGGQSPSNAWSLGCTKDTCSALVAGFTLPAPVVAVPLPTRKTNFVPAVSVVQAPAAPFVTSNQVVRTIDQHLSEMTAARVADNTLVGWVTYFVEPPLQGPAPAKPPPAKGATTPNDPVAATLPGDPKKPTAANLSVLALDPSGKAIAPPTVISVRAMSAGGVSIAAGAANNKDACLAWVARDGGDPQVFVTRVTADGKRDGQQMLTRIKGDASDAAIAWAGDGWIVGWIDTRDGNGEVYVAKVDRALRKVVQDTRITTAPGDASDVGLFVRGNEVFVTWSDPRDHAKDGHGDPFVQKLQASTLARIGQEVVLDQSPMHARSVHVAAAGQDLVAGWLAQPLNDGPGDQSRPAGPRFVRLDPKTTAPMGDAAMTRWEPGRLANSFGFACSDDICKGIVASNMADSIRVDAVVWFPSSPALQSKPLVTLTGPPGEDIFPSLVGDQVLYSDEANGGDVRIRRTKLQWTSP
jgi:hypothetical protein